jgi:hypothetical protein
MEDRDWMAEDHGLSHFSSHENHTQGALLADIGLVFSFPVRNFLFKAGGWFSYMRFTWDSMNGYLQHGRSLYDGNYEAWDPSITKLYHYGPAISYTQYWILLSPGISFEVRLFNTLILEAGVTGSPAIWGAAEDIHHGSPDREMVDIFSHGLYIEPRFEIGFSPHKRLELDWYFSYRSVSGSRGDTYSRSSSQANSPNMGNYSSISDSVGAAFNVVNTGISLKVLF